MPRFGSLLVNVGVHPRIPSKTIYCLCEGARNNNLAPSLFISMSKKIMHGNTVLLVSDDVPDLEFFGSKEEPPLIEKLDGHYLFITFQHGQMMGIIERVKVKEYKYVFTLSKISSVELFYKLCTIIPGELTQVRIDNIELRISKPTLVKVVGTPQNCKLTIQKYTKDRN